MTVMSVRISSRYNLVRETGMSRYRAVTRLTGAVISDPAARDDLAGRAHGPAILFNSSFYFGAFELVIYSITHFRNEVIGCNYPDPIFKIPFLASK